MLVGASLKRKEDARLVAGRGRYLDDIALPGMLHLGLVRSPHAHARIVKVDGDDARRMEGVVVVWTLADLPELMGTMVPPLVPEPRGRPYVHPVLAGDRARHAGDAVAVVVAESAYRLADAIERVRVEYELLPTAVTPATALMPSAPRVHEEWADNLAAVSASQIGAVTAEFDRAEVVVHGRFTYSRVGGMPIEPRGVLAVEDATGTLLVWSSTQVPFAVRSGIARALDLPEERIRVMVPEVGGGFGVKGHAYPEDTIVPAVARRLGRPVKWVETRREHFLSSAADRDQTHDARIALRRDGVVVALETSFTRDHGAFTTLGEAITLNTINHLPGPYRIPNYRGTGKNVITHKTFAAAYRGAGRPEGALVMDRLLDRAARRLGMDPAELRRRNLIRPEDMPYVSGLTYRDGAPIVYDPADYPAQFNEMLRRLDYARWRQEQARRRPSEPAGRSRRSGRRG